MTSTNGSELFRLSARAPDRCTRIELLDGSLRPIDLARSLGEVNLQLPAGVYAIRFCRGPHFTERLALLSPESPQVEISPSEAEMPPFASAAPLDQTTTTREWQSGPAGELSLSRPRPPPAGHRGGSHLLVFLRDPFSEYGRNGTGPPPEISLHDYSGRPVFRLSEAARHYTEHWLGAHLELDPGCYRLRRERPGLPACEQIVFTCTGWQSQMFLLAAEPRDEPGCLSRLSLLMSRVEVGFDHRRDDLRWTEIALRALRHRTNIAAASGASPPAQISDSPVLEICTALLLLRRLTIEVAPIRAHFLALHRSVGPLPDVLAIGLALTRRDPTLLTDPEIAPLLHNSAALAHPPMLRDSWNHILQATADHPRLVPRGTLADNLGGRIIAHDPWLTWRVDSPEAPAAGPVIPATADEKDVSIFPMPISDALLLHRMRIAQSQLAQAFDPGSIINRLVEDFVEQTPFFTLRDGLPLLSRWLAENPEAADELASPRFLEIERQIACWLQPRLDLRLPPELADHPLMADELAALQERHAENPALILVDLGLSSPTAVAHAWNVYTKLFVKPVVPRRPHLDAYVNQLVGTRPVLRSRLDERAAETSLIRHRRSGRLLSLLEVTYLVHIGSPADPQRDGSVDCEILAHRLDEAGYRLAPDDRAISSADLLTMTRELMPEISRGQ